MDTELSKHFNSSMPSRPEGTTLPLRPQPKWRTMLSALSLVALGAGGAVAGGYLTTGHPLKLQRNAETLPSTVTEQLNAAPSKANSAAALLSNNFITRVVEQVGPAVVRINATRTVRNSSMPDTFDDPFFREFFGRQLPTPPSKEVQRGVGSGFILNANGEILTNAHVVNGTDTVTVTLKDGRTLKGKVMGVDPVTDVAVVKVEAENLPTVKLGNSQQLKPGEWAIAIGNPLGLDNTVTVGIISATGRSSSQVGASQERVNFIQTDAAINPGNSGGPLLNAQGEVIGVNTAIIQNAQGIGFAIPIQTVQRIAQQLISKGKVEHSYLGIQIATLTPEFKQQLNEDPNSGLSVGEDKGVLVARVEPNSPAARAGLKAGDVIHRVEGKEVADADTLQQQVESTSAGGSLTLGLNRNGKAMNITVKAGTLTDQLQEQQEG
jgi:Do/DeqQ family serine protease